MSVSDEAEQSLDTTERDRWAPPVALAVAAAVTFLRLTVGDNIERVPAVLLGRFLTPRLPALVVALVVPLSCAALLVREVLRRAPPPSARAWSDGHGWFRAFVSAAILSQPLVVAARFAGAGVLPLYGFYGSHVIALVSAAVGAALLLTPTTRVIIDPAAGIVLLLRGHPVPLSRQEHRIADFRSLAIEHVRVTRRSWAWRIVAHGGPSGARIELLRDGSEARARARAAALARFAGWELDHR